MNPSWALRARAMPDVRESVSTASRALSTMRSKSSACEKDISSLSCLSMYTRLSTLIQFFASADFKLMFFPVVDFRTACTVNFARFESDVFKSSTVNAKHWSYASLNRIEMNLVIEKSLACFVKNRSFETFRSIKF